jgi:hypothetical protein
MTTTYNKRTNSERFSQYQFDAETRGIERELQTPWPQIDIVTEVGFRRDMNDPNNVVIDVIGGRGYITTRVRDAQAAIVEAAGYAMRAGWNFSPVGELPDVFVAGFLALVEVMPVEVQS